MLKYLNFISKKDIKTASIGSLVIKFGSAFFAFLNGVLLARYLSIEGLGYYVLAFTTLTIISVPATIGLPNLITRYISKYEVEKNFAGMKGLLIKTNLFVLISTIVIYFIAAITYFFWWKNYDSVFVETLLYSFLLLPILGFGALRSAALRGLKLIILSELPDTLLRNFLLTILLIGCILLEYPLSPQLAIVFQIVAAGIGFLLGFLFLYKKLLNKLKKVSPIYNTKEWYVQTIPFSINSGIQIVRSKLLTYLLAIFGSIEAVAIFDVAMRGAALVSFTLNALNSAISPFISSAYEKGNTLQIQKIVKKTGRIIFAFSLPVALIFILGGKGLVMYIFGNEYAVAYFPLLILCIGQLVSAMVGSVGTLLSMTGNQKVFSNSNVIMLIINMILGVPLIMIWDEIGAALLFSAILIIQNYILLKYVQKNLNINTSIF